jgi:Tir chaperone protein (CesT) family
MDRGQADILVGDLAKAMGIPALALDAGGMCILALEEGPERVIVSIGHNAAAGALDLMCCLDSVDPSPRRDAEALIANTDMPAHGAATLAAEPKTGAYIVQRRYFGAEFDEGSLPAAVVDFVDDALAWAKRLNGIEDEPQSYPVGSLQDVSLRA